MKKLISVFSFFLLFNCYGQNNNHSEIVFFEDAQLSELLQKIITPENLCEKKKGKYIWYIEFKNDNLILVSQSRIANILELVDDSNIYATTINENVVFILTENIDFNHKGSNYFIDLSLHKDEEIVLFEDLSYWHIKKSDTNYELVNEKIWKCN